MARASMPRNANAIASSTSTARSETWQAVGKCGPSVIPAGVGVPRNTARCQLRPWSPQAVLAIQWLWSGGRGHRSPRLPRIPA
jgi:hypothetical protein